MRKVRNNLYSNYQERKEWALERAADHLLAQAGVAKKTSEYPFHSEKWLQRASLRDNTVIIRQQDYTSLSLDQCRKLLGAVINAAPLSSRQRLVLQMRQCNCSFSVIAQRLDCSVSATRRLYKRAVKICRENLDAILSSLSTREAVRMTFHDTARKPAFRHEQHCRPGREACRQDGLCRYRWYLLLELSREDL